MQSLVHAATDRWNWRTSAHTRLVSLASVWFLVFFASLVGPLLPILGVIRMVFGAGQLGLNHVLARRTPIAKRDRFDWAMLLLAFAGSIFAASMVRITGVTSPWFVLPLLLPYSALQWRSFERSLDAHRGVPVGEAPAGVIPFPAASPTATRRAA